MGQKKKKVFTENPFEVISESPLEYTPSLQELAIRAQTPETLREHSLTPPVACISPSPTPKSPSDPNFFYNQVDVRGHVCKYKIESGVHIKVKDLGNIKDYFNRAIEAAAVMTPDQIATINYADLSHIQIAAIKLAAFAAAGCLKSTQELFDRVLGKPKQFSESTNLEITIDDILNGIPERRENLEETEEVQDDLI